MRKFLSFSGGLLWMIGCQEAPKPANAVAEMPVYRAELLGANASWGNTEGPAIDSKNNLYFTSRGTYRGIVKWSEEKGFEEWAAVAIKQGPGGLWADEQDNLYITATGEQQILKIAPDKKVTVVAEKFDVMPKESKGPNDLVVLPNGVVLFTEPNGYDGKSPKGTVYRIDRQGKVSVFSQEITGPNGIILSPDKKTVYVAHNVAENTSNIVKWTIDEEGVPGPMRMHAKIEPCQADGMDVNQQGNLWLTCYSHGTAYLIDDAGKVREKITTGQKALTNCKFGRGDKRNWLYLTSSDMARVTGYVYRVKLPAGGLR
jgi:sugar lactone lactonase YvrE